MDNTIGHNTEAMIDISANRTLIAAKFTIEDPLKPQIIYGLQTLDQVFQQYSPHLNFRFEDAEGFSKPEKLFFKSIDDFNINGISQQSSFLKAISKKRDSYLKIAKQLKTSKQLKEVLQHDGKRHLFQTVIQSMINELEKNKK